MAGAPATAAAEKSLAGMSPAALGVPRLGGAVGWKEWKRQVKAALRLRGVEIDPQAKDAAADSAILDVIMLTVDKERGDRLELAQDAVEKKGKKWTAQQAMDKLRELFEGNTQTEALQLTKALATLSKQPGENISQYISRAMELHRRLVESKMSPELLVLGHMLDGLPSEYEVVRSVLQNHATDLTFSKVEASLLGEERKVAGKHQQEEAVALAAFSSGGRAGFSSGRAGMGQQQQRFGGRGGGSSGKAGPKGSSRPAGDKSKHQCYHCLARGHHKAECKHRALPAEEARRLAAAASGPVQANVAVASAPVEDGLFHCMAAQVGDAASSDAASSAAEWAIDSGATWHMSPHAHTFTTYKPLAKPIMVKVADHGVLGAAGIGCVEMKVEGTGQQVRLQEVLHVPLLGSNLLSVRAACKSGCKVQFSSGKGTIVRGSTTVVEAVEGAGGLFTFRCSYGVQPAAVALAAKVSPTL